MPYLQAVLPVHVSIVSEWNAGVEHRNSRMIVLPCNKNERSKEQRHGLGTRTSAETHIQKDAYAHLESMSPCISGYVPRSAVATAVRGHDFGNGGVEHVTIRQTTSRRD